MPRKYALGSTPNAWSHEKPPTTEHLDAAVEQGLFEENPVKVPSKAQAAPARPAKPVQRPAAPERSAPPQKPPKLARPAPARVPQSRPSPARAMPKPPKTRRRSKGATEHRFVASFTSDGWRRLEAAAKRTGQSAAGILRVLVDVNLEPA